MSSREDTPAGSAFAEVVPNPRDPSNRDSAGNPRPTFPMATFNDAEWTYIRREGNIREELYHLGKDAKQQHNLVREQDAKPTLERAAQALGRMTGGPLASERFSP